MESAVFSLLKGLSSEGVEFELFDERLETPPERLDMDIVCITVETFTVKRTYEIISKYRKRGVKLRMGVVHSTLDSMEASEHTDEIVTCDVECIWDEITLDLEKGSLKLRYEKEQLVNSRGIYFPEGIYIKGRGTCSFHSYSSAGDANIGASSVPLVYS